MVYVCLLLVGTPRIAALTNHTYYYQSKHFQPQTKKSWLVGRPVCHNFLNGWKISLPCFYRSTCFVITSPFSCHFVNFAISISLFAKLNLAIFLLAAKKGDYGETHSSLSFSLSVYLFLYMYVSLSLSLSLYIDIGILAKVINCTVFRDFSLVG